MNIIYSDIGYSVSIFGTTYMETSFLGTHTMSIWFGLKIGCDRVVSEQVLMRKWGGGLSAGCLPKTLAT
jgi:hypothetical protein